MGGLLQEIGARKEYNGKGTWPEYSQFVLIIRELILSIRILKAQVGRKKIRLHQTTVMETDW
jgi:hypothetical protein